MSLRSLPTKGSLRGKRVLVRVDWNVPIVGLAPDESLKIERTLPTLHALAKRGAVVIVLTHLGRPTQREKRYSTKRLAQVIEKRYGTLIQFHDQSVSREQERRTLLDALATAPIGSMHLLENVRFESGEETNDLRLAKAYASLGQMFVNEAFASCHRAHASVVGIAKRLPSYAGPSLVSEVMHAERLTHTPKRPFVTVIGGAKLSTKMPVLVALLASCDEILIGGAMATTLFAAKKRKIGKSLFEKSAMASARKLVTQKKIILPIDVTVTEHLSAQPTLRYAAAENIGARDIVIDVGPKTARDWGARLKRAKTILWNGPVGIVEIHAAGFGSRFLARTIANQARRGSFTAVGGGDTLPIIVETNTLDRFDFVSTGGGALLEFLANKGKLPGLAPLRK